MILLLWISNHDYQVDMNRVNKLLFRALQLPIQICPFSKVKFPLPDLGEKIKEGTVKKLYVKEGDKVEEFQKIADVESDKQFTEITSPEEGFIAKLYYQETEVCKVGDLFLEIETAEEESASIPKKEPSHKHPERPASKQTTAKQPSHPHTHTHTDISELRISGVAKMYASAYRVDLHKVSRSGPKGRILKEDVLNYISEHKLKFVPKSPPSPQIPQPIQPRENKKVRMNAYQQGMQKSMTAANQVPHLYLHEKIDISELESLRSKLKADGVKVTMTGLLTKMFSLALSKHPRINSTYKPSQDEFSFETHVSHNISIAIDSPNGLVAPNIKNVQDLTLMQINEQILELKALSEQARLTREHLSGGTICISNIGTIAGISACPLVVCPQICIVALGKIVETPVYHNSGLIKKKFMTMSFGCDHRVIDGASVARFSNEWKRLLENPYLALAQMR